MIAKSEIDNKKAFETSKRFMTYTPEQAEHDYLVKQVKEKYSIIRDICNMQYHCHDCGYFLEILTHPAKYPDLQHCIFPAYTNEQLRHILEIHE